MLSKYVNFVRGVSAGNIGKLGVVLTTSSFVTMIVLEIARMVGILTSTYIGLITYLGLPSVFVIGLILIPIGWRIQKKRTGKTTRELLEERFDREVVQRRFLGSKFIRTVVLFSLLNILFLGGASVATLGFMDEAEFCGTACHSVMNPEWVTYQQSPHSRVKCVECHVGEGADALINSKLNGAWQMVSVTFDLLERPIPTPVHQLRPARETCEKCHWPDKFYGSRLKTIYRYDRDSASTRRFTTLNLKVDPDASDQEGGIHWHIAEENEVRYVSTDDKREEMIWVDVRQDDGSFKRFRNKRISRDHDPEADVRVLDCVDCHNRATHIYEDPDRAIDDKIRVGRLDRSLPYIKREALQAITADYATKEAGLEGIANHINTFYMREYPYLARKQIGLIDDQIATLQEIYSRNIHPEMNIVWGSYPSHIGHVGDGGCFRCHNEAMVADDGSSISYDCTNCHSLLANESDEPFKFLLPADTADLDYRMHQYLKEEFLDSYRISSEPAH